MDIQDIIALAKAGFTAAQIAAMQQTAPATPTPTHSDPPAPTPAPSAPTETPAAPTPAPAVPAQPDLLQQILQQQQQMMAAMQQQAIHTSSAPGQEPESVESILASIINPPTKGGSK